jgi:hypothetical protein
LRRGALAIAELARNRMEPTTVCHAIITTISSGLGASAMETVIVSK